MKGKSMLLIDAKIDNSSSPATQEISLDDLVDKVRQAHAGVATALSNAVQHAIGAGQTLLAAKRRTPHGGWTTFLKRCELRERTAERYVQLARLAQAKPSSTTDLVGLTIEGAIKKLSPPVRSRIGRGTKRETERAAKPKQSDTIVASTVSHTDIIDVWLKASPAVRRRAVDSIGLATWLDAVPQDWLPRLEQLLTERRQSCIAIVPPEPTQAPDDLSVPEFLRRECQENDAQADNDAANLPNESEEEDHDELEPKPKRKRKIIEHQYSIAEPLEIAQGDLSGLASECRQATDAAPDSLQPTERFQVLAASADALEDVADEGPTMARLGVSA
jgi:hypothetical protein